MTENNTCPEVYIAGPLFNPEENLHNDTLTKMFRDLKICYNYRRSDNIPYNFNS